MKDQWRKYTDRPGITKVSGKSVIQETEWYKIINLIFSDTQCQNLDFGFNDFGFNVKIWILDRKLLGEQVTFCPMGIQTQAATKCRQMQVVGENKLVVY